jgi:hypothetical protein
LTGPTLEQYENLLLSEKYKEANMVGMTTYEKGMAKGEVEGQRKTIQRQLEKRFGHLGSSGRHKLAALSVEQLEQLSVNLIDATSLRELGLEE